MKFSLELIVAFAGLMAYLPDVQAAPAKTIARRDNGMIHMPLERITPSLEKKGVDNVVVHQQHANRAHRRYAQMTGRDAPSSEEMHEAIAKRMYIPDGGFPSFKPVAAPKTSRMFIPKNGVPRPAKISARKGGDDTLYGALEKIVAALQGGGASSKKEAAAVAPAKQAAPAAAADANGADAGADDSGDDGLLGADQSDDSGSDDVDGANDAGDDSGAGAAGATGAAASGNGAGAAAAGSTAQGFSPVDAAAAKAKTVTASNVKPSNGTLGLDIEANDVGYFGTVQIGTPPKDFKVIMDSGSADFWVGGANCQNAQTKEACSAKHQTLSTKGSSTLKSTGKQFQVTYGSGAVAGITATDDVSIGGLTLKNLPVGVALLETSDFADDSVATDGLMGLAQSTLSNQKVLTPIEQLAKDGTVSDAIIGFKISRLADQKNDGQITFGGLDASKFDASTLVDLPNVSKTGFWESAMDAVTVDGKDLGLQGRTAILDSGTTLIIAPPADAAQVHAAIKGSKTDGSGTFTIPCTFNQQLSLTFGGKSFSIDPRDMTFLPANAANPTGDCISGIMAGQIGGAQEWLVGDVFLKNAYFGTDVGKNSMSLAKLV